MVGYAAADAPDPPIPLRPPYAHTDLPTPLRQSRHPAGDIIPNRAFFVKLYSSPTRPYPLAATAPASAPAPLPRRFLAAGVWVVASSEVARPGLFSVLRHAGSVLRPGGLALVPPFLWALIAAARRLLLL